MQVEEQCQQTLNDITHSPYYGCAVRVVSKAGVSYEGVLDGISTRKDRIFLKNVHVNANLTPTPYTSNFNEQSDKASTSDTLNAVMIDHLTNDMHVYEQVCLNVRDIQELRLIQTPSTFHESKAKLRAIDPCLVDIRLSLSDENETRSNSSSTDQAPIARRNRGQSFGSNGGSALISSSSNESSSSFGLRSDERFTNESNDDSFDEGIDRFRQLSMANSQAKPATLLAKKVLPKKIDRHADMSAMKPGNSFRAPPPSDANRRRAAFQTNQQSSPIRVTITSNLNPNAIPFFTQQRNAPPMANSTVKFYERAHFRPRSQPVVVPDRSQSLPYGMNTLNMPPPLPPPPPPALPLPSQLQQHHHPNHLRFVPPRQLAMKKNGSQTRMNPRPGRAPPPPVMKYRFHPSITMDRRIYPQQQRPPLPPQSKTKTSHTGPFPGYVRQSSLPTPTQIVVTQPFEDNFSTARNNPTRRSTASVHSTSSLPYQYSSSYDRHRLHTPLSYADSTGSYRSQRTFSGASSSSSLSMDTLPHPPIRLANSPSLSNRLPAFAEQYDFEKANEEFRRYLELEELVVRRPSLTETVIPEQAQQLQHSNSYQKEMSFFDRISCTATTGTAVGYAEMDEVEKNLETFGDDALLLSSLNSDDEE